MNLRACGAGPQAPGADRLMGKVGRCGLGVCARWSGDGRNRLGIKRGDAGSGCLLPVTNSLNVARHGHLSFKDGRVEQPLQGAGERWSAGVACGFCVALQFTFTTNRARRAAEDLAMARPLYFC
jgi:hypothetical protein